MHALVRCDSGDRVLPVRVDSQELHAFLGIALLHLREARPVQLDQRTLRAEKREDDDLFLLIICESMRLAAKIVEDKTLHFPADGGRRGSFRAQPHGRKQCDESQTECKPHSDHHVTSLPVQYAGRPSDKFRERRAFPS